MVKSNAPGTTGSTSPQTSASGASGNLGGKPPPGIPAASSVAAFGGNRGGKPRKDGLVPGSPEAEAADKAIDAERKRQARAAQKLADPPPLPSAPANGSGPVAPPINGAGALPGAAPGVQSDAVPWDPAALRPLLEELIEGAEQSRVHKRLERAKAVGLPDRTVKELASGATYPAAAKRALALSGSNGTAKLMNSLGVSGKYSDVAIAVTALTAIAVSNKRSDAKFEEMIAEFKKAQGPKTNKP
jgi:hypothetical protein